MPDNETYRIFAGIGSRRTPKTELDLLQMAAETLCARRWTLRSGGAEGADTACMAGCVMAAHLHGKAPRAEIYLPWPDFNGCEIPYLECPKPDAYRIAAAYHPNWRYLRRPARALHARNAHIVLGCNLDDPVRLVLCWTPDGSLDGYGPDSGGTGQALRIARGETDAIILNIARPKHREQVERLARRVFV